MLKLTACTLLLCFTAISFAADAPEPTKEKLIGAWNVRIGDVDQDLNLKENGEFEQQSATGGMSGKWTLEKSTLILASDSGLKVRCPILKVTETELSIKLLGQPITYTRVKKK
jgi:hypothetical protein